MPLGMEGLFLEVSGCRIWTKLSDVPAVSIYRLARARSGSDEPPGLMQPTRLSGYERGVQMLVILARIFPCKCGRLQGWQSSQLLAETVIGAVVDPAITSSDPKKERGERSHLFLFETDHPPPQPLTPHCFVPAKRLRPGDAAMVPLTISSLTPDTRYCVRGSDIKPEPSSS